MSSIGLFSSYGIMCGVAEYSQNLARAMRALGHRVTLFGNFGGERIRPDSRWRLLPVDETDPFVVRCFDTPAWAHGGTFDFPRIEHEVRARGVSTVIISYQCTLYHRPYLERLLHWLRGQGIRTVATLHDSYLDFDLRLVDAKVVTGPGMLASVPDATVIPHGVLEVPLPSEEEVRRQYGLEGTLVATLGLGRTDYELIHRAVRRLGWRMLVFDPTRSCRLAGPHLVLMQRWLSQPEMVRVLRAARATVLWYPPVPAQVTSSAAHLAVAAQRPVIVNGTRWFADLPADVFIKVNDEDQLVAALARDVDPARARNQEAYARANSWTETAKRYLALCR